MTNTTINLAVECFISGLNHGANMAHNKAEIISAFKKVFANSDAEMRVVGLAYINSQF